MISKRLAAVRRKMADKGISGLLVTSRQNVFYLSGFDGSSGDLLITLDAAYILCDFRYTEQANQQATMFISEDIGKGIFNVINNIISHHSVTNLGIEDRALSYAAFNGIRKALKNVMLVPIGDLISGMRIIKDDIEIENLEKAAKIADIAFSDVISRMKAGMSEIEVAAEIEYSMRKNGANGISFDTIVASGVNSAKPHGVATNKKLENGDLVAMDFGCVYGGYCSDMTRTVAIGEINDKQKEVYNSVLFTQLKILNIIETGKKCCDIDRISRNELSTFGYSEYFGHSLGHGVGIEVHESPTMGPRSEFVLSSGMLVTVEPGVYLAGEFGVRIEDSVLITEQGIKVLTNSTKELIII